MATAADRRGPGPERAFAPDLPTTGDVVLDKEESAHLVRVRRVREGDDVVLFDARGATRQGRLITADAKAAVVTVVGEAPARAPGRRVRLAVSLPEPARADALVATAAELGVAVLQPMTCARTDPGRAALAERRAAKWARAAREALKVNGLAYALEIPTPVAFEALLAEPALLLDPDPTAPPLRDMLGEADPTPWLLIGPEGGFTDAELDTASTAGVATARLGGPALRTATAALVAAAAALLD